jgi:uncharacterized protein YecT (DUF1311 family)
MRAWLAAAALLLAAASREPENFATEGLEVSVPQGAATCRPESPRDRIAIYLDGGLEGCDQLDQRPYMEIRASENSDEFGSAQELLGDRCGSDQKGSVTALSFTGRRSASCRTDSPDTPWVDVFVATQADGKGIAKLNVEARLHTTLDRLGDDLVAFRGFLSHEVRLTRPEFVDTIDPLCEKARTQAELTECSGERAKRADAVLARSEAKLEDVSSPDQARAFDKARDAWLEYRKLHCEAVASLRPGGSDRPRAVSDCSTALTEERAREIERMLGDQNGSAAR